MDSLALSPALETKVGLYRSALDNRGLPDGIRIGEIITNIRGEKYAGITGELRGLAGETFNEYKRRMFPAVTWSGLFSPTRSKVSLTCHTGLMCLDLDELTDKDLVDAREKIKADPLTFICFTSPSGKGIKVVIRVEMNSPDQHATAYSQLEAYYKDRLGLRVDPSCRNVDRLCFLPHDPEIYVNKRSEVLKVDRALNKPQPLYPNTWSVRDGIIPNADEAEVFDWCLAVHDRSHSFVKGQRNHYLAALANFCNDYGVSREYFESQCVGRFVESDFTVREIKSTIKSIYMKTEQHG